MRSTSFNRASQEFTTKHQDTIKITKISIYFTNYDALVGNDSSHFFDISFRGKALPW